MFCTNCGNKLAPGDKFCTKCGTPVPVGEKNAGIEGSFSYSKSPDNISTPASGKKTGVLAAVIVVILLLIGSLVGVLLFSRNKATNKGNQSPDINSDNIAQTGTDAGRDTYGPVLSDNDLDAGKQQDADSQNAASGYENSEITEFYNKEIVDKYGILSNDNDYIDVFYKYDNYAGAFNAFSEWQVLEGVLAHTVEDLDHDGEDELLVIRFDKGRKRVDNGLAYYEGRTCYAEFYKKINDEIVLVNQEDLYDYYSGGTGERYMSIIRKPDKTYLLYSFMDSAYIFADGFEADMMIYDGTLKLYGAVYQTSGGSSDFEYTAFAYDDDGEKVYQEVIFSDERDDYKGEGDEYVYDLLARYGIKAGRVNIEYPTMFRLESMMKADPDSETLFSYKVVTDYNSNSGNKNADFDAVVSACRSFDSTDLHYEGNLIDDTLRRMEEKEDYYSGDYYAEGIVFPDSSVYKVDERRLRDLTDAELRNAINELYARKGYIFKDMDIRNFYRRFSWYEERINPSDFSVNMFNSVEKENIEAMQKERDRRRR